jgi:diaminohydroxyphosphoribosylaminopyrimidine deaminase/5-amino-6-(5-phosphoribosylamino)uracil reductase
MDDQQAMTLAVQAARAHEGATAPNPAVGCVVLDAAGAVLAVGAHARAGQPHAEAAALAQVDPARVHTVVVTLEPCNHQGRTGPCAGAILQTAARRVVYAVADPNPQASGGAVRLAAAGLTVVRLDHPGATRLAAPFVTRVTKSRPFITVKQALRDGSMIPPPGHKTFTDQDSLRLAHELRRRADAVLTGSGTVLADDPAFTVRHVPDHPGKTRALAILDRRGRIPAAYLTAAQARGFAAFIATDLDQALATLAAQGCNEVLIEAGPQICATLQARGLWDEWVRIEAGTPDRITVLTN